MELFKSITWSDAHIWSIGISSVMLCTVVLHIISLGMARSTVVGVRDEEASSAAGKARILARMPSAMRYRPPSWCTSPFVQIMSASVLRARPSMHFQRKILHCDRDGGGVALDWRSEPSSGKPVTIVLHGLTGGSQEKYIRWTVSSLESAGHTVVVMNARGCSRSELLTPKSFSAAFTDDVRATVAHVRELVGQDTFVGAVGYSLGAGILTKFVCEEGEGCGLDAAVACSASFDLSLSSRLLEQGFNKLVYNPVLAKSLRQYFARHQHHFVQGAPGHGKLDLQGALTAKTVRDFDAATIVPQFGYRDTEEYYRDGSTYYRIGGIGIPFLALNSLDDPICAADGLPREAFAANPNTMAILTQHGGHVAWIEQDGLAPWSIGPCWDNRVVVEYMAAVRALMAEQPGMFPARQKRLARARAQGTVGPTAKEGPGQDVQDDEGDVLPVSPHLEA